MPRSKPDNVQVFRIELGAWERERVKKAELVATTAVLLPAAGIAAAGIGGTLAGYALYQWLKDGPFNDIIDPIKDFFTGDLNEGPPLVWYSNTEDPTGQGRGFWERMWDNILGYKGPLEPLPTKE